MKLKTLAVVAVSTLLVSSFSYAATAMDAAPLDQNSVAADNNIGATPASNGNTPAAAPGMDLSANNVEQMPMVESGDEMSADTATGDDDY